MTTSQSALIRRGRFIRAARDVAGLTQADIAHVLKVARPTVSAIEAGDRDLSLSEGLILVKVLGVDVTQLERGG